MKLAISVLVAFCGFALILPQSASALFPPCSGCHALCSCSGGCTYYPFGPGFPVNTTCGAYTQQYGGSCLQSSSVGPDLSLEASVAPAAEKAVEGQDEAISTTSEVEPRLEPKS